MTTKDQIQISELYLEVSSKWVNNKIRGFDVGVSDYNRRRLSKVQKYADDKSDEEGGSFKVLAPNNKPYTLYIRSEFKFSEMAGGWWARIKMVDETSGQSYEGATRRITVAPTSGRRWRISLRDVGETGDSDFKFADRQNATAFYQMFVSEVPDENMKNDLRPTSFEIY